MRIGIIGCGVSGLTCGIRLLEAGFDVQILAREQSPHTTSDVAGAHWYPFKVEPRERVLPWAEQSYLEFAVLSADSKSGVKQVPVSHYYREDMPDVWWVRSVKGFCKLSQAELPLSCSSGIRYQTFLMETPIYMPYLRARFVALGGKITIESVANLDNLGERFNVIVNCSGVGAYQLANDKEVYPIRGQVIRTRRPASLSPVVLDDGGMFVVCRSSDCILGAANDDGDWSLEPRVKDRELVLQRVAEICPTLASPEILEDLVGLRPGRKEVRLELEKLASGLQVVHNYGHGGAGFTLSWGCAAEVVNIVRQL